MCVEMSKIEVNDLEVKMRAVEISRPVIKAQEMNAPISDPSSFPTKGTDLAVGSGMLINSARYLRD
ncbi:hypothetical protein N7530_012730 [Penicillium desertorum]|uniref:Uncharacterized protein n=1 Tax=Penicillium desertorum TaxID=1303715 RepID=A0A9W9WD99_9EURO|nr:hypothetical protein N7530_012730 [Penicillium desertorum]